MLDVKTFSEDKKYQDWSFDNAKPANIHPMVKELQSRHAQATYAALDKDVLDWLIAQDDETRHHANEILRHFIAVKSHA